jgi:hypothetical protein
VQQAKFTIMIPQRDNLGNHLGDVATAAHHWLFYGNGPKVHGSFIHRNLDGNWRDDPQEKFDHLVTIADDHPELDSHMKQLASHVADAANQWGVSVIKEGKNGPQLWIVDNPGYQEGRPAPIAQQSIPQAPPLNLG